MKQPNKKLSRKTLLLGLLFLLNSVLFPVLYFTLASKGFDAILIVYTVLAAVIAIVYMIYNKGFSGKNVTPEMLPHAMSEEEKNAFIEDSKKREAGSRWVLTILFPLILSLALDVMYLFLLPMIKDMFL